MTKKVLLLYTPLGHADSGLLEEVVATVFPPQATEIVHTLTDLAHRLIRPDHGLEVAIIMAADCKELEDLISIKHLLSRLRIILVLPDDDPQTISLGHLLRPRYLTFNQNDFQILPAVLNKIMKYLGAL